ncbi:MAG TPA: plastocyanin/azurin family copper-binding protein [Gaiellaceae bacterium]|nr:plastocyanin/azurin family copper-binding protein [Gaiellaceae bacterium]
MIVAAAAAVTAAVVAASAPAAGGIQVTGTVGPGFTITLTEKGKNVKTLAPGNYTFVINDKSNIHNFHLTGPGVNKKTSVKGVGKSTWHIALRAGTYKYVCDPHKTLMHGSFVVRAP